MVARRIFRLAFEVVALIKAVERSLDKAGILARLDLLLQRVALGPACDVHQRGHPIEGGEHLILNRARPNDARPTDDHRGAIPALPGLAFLALERCDATVRECDRLGAVVGGEHNDGVVGLAHLLDFLKDEADIVIHLLHAGFVDAPVLAALHAQHGLILRRQHGHDVHARRVVPDKEWLVGPPGIVAVEEVDHLGRDFLVHSFGPLERQRALVTAALILLRAVGGLARDNRARRHQAERRFLIHGAGDLGEAGDRGVLARRRDALHGRRRIDVGEAHLLHRVEVIEVAPIFLEAVRRRQGRGVVAQMVLAELAGVVAEIEQGLWRPPEYRAANRTGCPAVAAGSCRYAADTCR